MNYISFSFMNICLTFIFIFTYVISSDGLTKEEPSARKIEGHFFFFQMFLALPKKGHHFKGGRFLVFQNKGISNKRKSRFVGSTS